MRIIERSKQAHDAPILHRNQEYSFPYSWTGLSGTHMQHVRGSVKEVGTVLVEGWGEDDTKLLASWGTTTYHHEGIFSRRIASARCLCNPCVSKMAKKNRAPLACGESGLLVLLAIKLTA